MSRITSSAEMKPPVFTRPVPKPAKLRGVCERATSKEMSEAEAAKAALLASLDKASIEQIASDPELLRSAVAGGNAAFKVNCVQCHGSGAAGSRGYPNLADDDWLWGGSLPEIQQTILNGIRHPGDDRIRVSEMSAFGRDG